MVERHQKLILDSIHFVAKIVVVIVWAVNNSHHNCHGYSPNQLVFGHNPSLTFG